MINEKECVLIMDEMAITPSSIFDASLNKYFGKITLPEHEEMQLMFSCSCLVE
jgi:hypothetical protein